VASPELILATFSRFWLRMPVDEPYDSEALAAVALQQQAERKRRRAMPRNDGSLRPAKLILPTDQAPARAMWETG
jgi:hypothetical protein